MCRRVTTLFNPPRDGPAAPAARCSTCPFRRWCSTKSPGRVWRRWETVLLSEEAEQIRTAEGYQIGGVSGPEAADDADVVIVPSWYEDGRRASAPLRGLLTDAHDSGATVAGLCLGTIPVADAGLLTGRRAVTHWQAFDLLVGRHPDLKIDETVLYIDHGDVFTSAGTASALDACLHLVRTRLGASAANHVARSLVIAPHREGGQAQYIQRPLPEGTDEDPISEVLDWVIDHLDEPLPVERLAADCGFGSAVTMRQNFTAAFRTIPSGYRRAFGAGSEAQAPVL